MLPIFFTLLLFCTQQSFAMDLAEAAHKNAYIQKYIDQVDQQKIYQEKAWQKLLFISPSTLPGPRSVIDDPNFFFAKKGKTNPKKELKASLTAFLSPQKMTLFKEKRHPQCFFAARWFWIKHRLKIQKKDIPKVECKARDVFDKNLDYSKVTLVFSSYYVNSPASMFGHTLLRLHRETKGRKAFDNGLLDDAVNFAATVNTKNPLVYAYKGLGGGFKGNFALLPYYKKILDYSHSERRDIWEYELNFTKEEMNFLKLLIYELGFFYVDYYYADDNCSFVLLKVLEAVRPSLKLSNEFPAFTVPSDTVKILYEHKPNIINNINFRPSSHTKYISRAKTLTAEERKITKTLLKKKSLNKLEQCSKNCKKENVIDTTLEFIDYKTSIVTLKEKNKYSQLRSDMLFERSQIKTPPKTIDYSLSKSTPHVGHYSALLSLSGLTNGDDSFDGLGYLQFRPALHDFDNNSKGYSSLLKTGFGDVTLEYDAESSKLDLFEAHLIEIFTLRTREPFSFPLSWHADLGLKSDAYDKENKQVDKRYYFEMGVGKTLSLFNKRLYFYTLAHWQLGFSELKSLRSYAGANLHSGLILPMGKFMKLTAFGRYEWLFGKDDLQFFQGSAKLNFYPATQHEVFLESTRRGGENFYGLGYRRFL